MQSSTAQTTSKISEFLVPNTTAMSNSVISETLSLDSMASSSSGLIGDTIIVDPGPSTRASRSGPAASIQGRSHSEAVTAANTRRRRRHPGSRRPNSRQSIPVAESTSNGNARKRTLSEATGSAAAPTGRATSVILRAENFPGYTHRQTQAVDANEPRPEEDSNLDALTEGHETTLTLPSRQQNPPSQPLNDDIRNQQSPPKKRGRGRPRNNEDDPKWLEIDAKRAMATREPTPHTSGEASNQASPGSNLPANQTEQRITPTPQPPRGRPRGRPRNRNPPIPQLTPHQKEAKTLAWLNDDSYSSQTPESFLKSIGEWYYDPLEHHLREINLGYDEEFDCFISDLPTGDGYCHLYGDHEKSCGPHCELS